MRVVDTSVGMKWFLRERDSDLALALLHSGERLVAPDVIVTESAHAGRRRARLGEISESVLRDLLCGLHKTLDEIVPTGPLAEDAVRLARELGQKETNDGFFLALARRRGVPVVTADLGFVASAKRAGYGGLVVKLDDAAR